MVDVARHARQLVLPGFGNTAHAALADARVLVIGAGGLGSAVLPHLVGSGVGTGARGRIGIIDDDVVELSNLHRQHLHATADIGRRKVDSAAERLTALDPAVTIVRHRERFTAANALSLLADYDVLVDGSDGFTTRYLAADAATLSGTPLVWGAVLQFDGHVGVSPVGGPGYRDLFPVAPDPSTVLDCATGGVLSAVCGVIGAMMAAQVVLLVTGVGEPLIGRVATYDARSGRSREVTFAPDPLAQVVTTLLDDPAHPRTEIHPENTATHPDLISPTELAALLSTANEGPNGVLLLDVREQWEHDLVALPGSRLMPLATVTTALDTLPRDRAIVVYCHHGIRSRRALDELREAGVTARHLEGGIDAWSSVVDPTMPRY